MRPARILVVEDGALFRESLCSLLEAAGHRVVEAMEDAEDLAEVVEDSNPDLLIMDVRLPPTHRREGLDAAFAMKAARPDIGIIVLSQHPERSYLEQLLNTGGIGYLLKQSGTNRAVLMDAIESVREGGTVVDPHLVDDMLSGPNPLLDDLTRKERQVLGLVAEGATNAQIAGKLYVSTRTVESHLASVFKKLDIPVNRHRRVQAVVQWLNHE